VSGATWTSEGLANGAYRFDGNDSLSVTCNSTLQLNGWTLSCWFKLDNTDDPFDLISRGFHLGDYRNYQMSVLGGKLYCMYEDISGTDATAEWSGLLTLNTWYHAAYVYDGSQTYLYVNGFLLSSHAQSITPRTNQTDALKIGEYPGWSMKGIIDEVRVYNRGLSSAEILSLYNYYSPANAPTNNLNVAGDVLISGKVAAESLEGKGAGLTDIPDTALTSGADFMKASVWSAGQAWSNTNKVDHAETAEAAGFAFSSDSAYVSEYAWLWGSWGGPAIYAPSGQGSAGQILATDGSGSTYWTDIGTSADSSDLSMGTFTNRPAQ